MRPMSTNGGAHPADKWADTTTDAIMSLIEIAADSVSPEAAVARSAKRTLAPILFGIFNDHHTDVQNGERFHLDTIKLAYVAAEHVASPLDVTPHLSVMDRVFAALAATPFAAHFAQPHVQAVLTQIVGNHTADVMHIERRWHLDRLNAAQGA
jgi:hypothetical protein